MRLYLLLAGLIFLSSCISNRKITYLQKNDLHAENLVKDSVVRTYAIDTFAYRIQPNDVLSIRFESLTPKEFDFFSANAQQSQMNPAGMVLLGELVNEQGEISYPVIGKIKVSGLTVFEIQNKLQTAASTFLDSPIVKVRLVNYRATFLGEISHEGVVTLENNRVNFLEAIGRIGGFTDLADKSNVKLIRQIEGKTEVVYLNLLDEDFIKSPYFYVYQNDVIIVPPLKQRPFRKYAGENLAVILSTISLIVLTVTLIRN